MESAFSAPGGAIRGRCSGRRQRLEATRFGLEAVGQRRGDGSVRRFDEPESSMSLKERSNGTTKDTLRLRSGAGCVTPRKPSRRRTWCALAKKNTEKIKPTESTEFPRDNGRPALSGSLLLLWRGLLVGGAALAVGRSPPAPLG